ncbi:MAG: hypothetical protein DHS20C01_06890 [marine bacterium B5-7]|nr:MAG: hypothetical protein DHS20C01_06890 [marine bacterium B5-7]
MKILILGLAKSGTTALAYKIHAALGLNARLEFEPDTASGAENLSLHDDITSIDDPVVTKNLIFPTNQMNWDNIFANVAKYDRAIWIARDPRDIIISNFFYHWFQGHKAKPEAYRLALARTRAKESNPAGTPFVDLVAGTMTDNRAQLEAWQRSWYDILTGVADRISANMYVLRYEDFVDERFGELNQYLGLSLEGDTEVADEHRRVVRTRGYDNWRRWFTDEDIKFFRPILSEYLNTMGYDANDWALESPDRLPAAQGSEYMEKLRSKDARKSRRPLSSRIKSKITAILSRRRV